MLPIIDTGVNFPQGVPPLHVQRNHAAPHTLTFTSPHIDNDGLPVLHVWQFRLELDGQLGIMFSDEFGAFGTALPPETIPHIQAFLKEHANK